MGLWNGAGFVSFIYDRRTLHDGLFVQELDFLCRSDFLCKAGESPDCRRRSKRRSPSILGAFQLTTRAGVVWCVRASISSWGEPPASRINPEGAPVSLAAPASGDRPRVGPARSWVIRV